MKSKWLVMMLTLGALLLVGSLGSNVVAERLLQGSGDGSGEGIALSTALALENAPDMDGYSGSVLQGITNFGAGSSSGDELPGALPDWGQFLLEPQPDQDEGAIRTADAGIEWSGTYYKYIAGSTFRPRASTTTWGSLGSGGCVYAVAGGSEVFNVPLSLPQGSRIDYLRLYYYDTDAGNSQAWVTIYDGAGGLVDLPNTSGVASSGDAGYGEMLSIYMGHIVDNSNNAYVLNWRANVAGSTMGLCGMSVAYRLP
ncbi:MAG: hypothetical protein RBT75_04690 [Anaerolineae bacterium]|jgi:hypothetical protein|nr:hypothetical protein [Anaerolineae bacterium]